MTHYSKFENNLLDRMDLKYSVYIAGLDVQFSADLPYLWTFCFDCTGEVFYGRDWKDLNEFFSILEEKAKFTYDHKLLVYINDLTRFFTYARTQIFIDPEPFLAKSPSELLLFSSKGLEFRSFDRYTEKDIDKFIKINMPEVQHEAPDPDGLSAEVKLTEEEMNYSALRVLEMTKAIRYDLDMIYQGITKNIKLTKTRRIELVLKDQRRKDDKDDRLYWQIHRMNPLSTEYGLTVLLPQLRKAFYGGTVFYEKGMLNELLEDVVSADLVSAYCAEFILSKFPISKFKVMKVPTDYHDLFTDIYYTAKAMLITFEARDVELKEGGLAILPAAMKHYYIDRNSPEERKDAIRRAQSLKLKSSKVIRMCLTDIDFRLFVKYYNFDEASLKIIGINGANYGYLPDYIIKTVAELYSNKAAAKEKLKKLEAAGYVDPLQDELYKDEKSAIARLYGIFTQSPVVVKYIFDPSIKNMKIVNSEYIVQDNEWRPVVYQWGVWTTARVRQKLCLLRDTFAAGNIKVVSGDTDCINLRNNRGVYPIITDFNEKIKSKIERRCKAVGIDPEALADLGTLEAKRYKYYRLTSAKQYAVVRETSSGDVFETVCGGMSKECKYFEDYSPDPVKRIEHFRLGLVIPSDYSPRKVTRQCSGYKKIDFIDREGHRIQGEVNSYQVTESMKFSLCDPFSSLVPRDQPAAFVPGGAATVTDVINSTTERVGKIKTAVHELPKKGRKKNEND